MLPKKSTMSMPILVLNKSWIPISITTVRKAITKTMLGLAEIMDVDSYVLHNFEAWMNLRVQDETKIIRTTKSIIRLPEIIVLTEYERLPVKEVRLTRRNLLIRDNFTCQYTGKKITADTATIDHVIPRSKGGKSTWENLVMCTRDINFAKADRTPEEAKLKLLKKPERPKWSPIYARFAKLAAANVPNSWLRFINIEGNPFGWVDV